MTANDDTSRTDVQVSTDGGDDERRRVDQWALQQQAHSFSMALSRVHEESEPVTRAIQIGNSNELDQQDFHYAWSALSDAIDELLLLTHLAGYERFDVGAITWGEATDEEIERFERQRCEGNDES